MESILVATFADNCGLAACTSQKQDSLVLHFDNPDRCSSYQNLWGIYLTVPLVDLGFLARTSVQGLGQELPFAKI